MGSVHRPVSLRSPAVPYHRFRRSCVGAVRDGAPGLVSLDEAWVQRLWFEQLYRRELRTVDGEKITILQPGFWNHGPGPDFLHAALVNGEGSEETGAVEIHLRAPDWGGHGHERDPAYDGVILHVVWEGHLKTYFTRTSRARTVRTVVLSRQLAVPLGEVRAHFSSSRQERALGARVGACQKALARLPDEAVFALLQDAGLFRFRQRAAAWALRLRVHGRDAALWLGLADAMGYSSNREAFVSLAQRLPLPLLQETASARRREALLFGVAGFLPERMLPVGGAGADWARGVWDEWWRYRGDWQNKVLSGRLWSLRGLRPMNRPERRLALVSLLSGRKEWKVFSRLALSAELEDLVQHLGGLKHPFWSQHNTLSGVRMAKATALAGRERVQAFWYNVAAPMAYAGGREEVLRQLPQIRAAPSMRPSEVAALRLLGRERGSGKKEIGVMQRSLLVREGLLQIYQDFCLNDFRQCMQCDFPELVKNWKPQKA